MVATCAPGDPLDPENRVAQGEGDARRTAGLRAAAMAKSAPAARAAPATSAGSAATAAAISAGACGRTSWSPASSVPVSTSPDSAHTSGTGRPVPLVWAESGLVLTGTLLAGDQDVRPHAPALIAAAVAALPDGVGRPRLRADSGLFSAEVAGAALAAGADFAIAAARNPAVRRAIRSIPKTAWRKAKG